MDSEDGFTKIHFLVAAVFGLTVVLGSFAGTMALTQMDEGEMSDVTGQEGIAMDLHLGSSFAIDEVDYIDGDGATGADGGSATSGVVGIHGIEPAGNFALTGITVNAASSGIDVGGSSSQAIVIGLPDIPSGITVSDIQPGGADSTTFTSSVGDADSIGGFAAGGIDMSNATLEITADS